jgi:hypothetical protein
LWVPHGLNVFWLKQAEPDQFTFCHWESSSHVQERRYGVKNGNFFTWQLYLEMSNQPAILTKEGWTDCCGVFFCAGSPPLRRFLRELYSWINRRRLVGAGNHGKALWTSSSSSEHHGDRMREKGIFLCDAECPATGRPCTAKFLLESGRAKHTSNGKHSFPMGIRSKDKAALLASSAGGALAVGSRPDRMTKVVQRQIREAPEGSRGLENVGCYGKFNRIEGKPVYQKPAKLRAELLRLYNIGGDKKSPKLNAAQIHGELRKMVDPVDRGLLFCHSKRGTHVAKKDPAYKSWAGCPICKAHKTCTCNGMLPTIAMIQNFINGTTQSNNKKKKNDSSWSSNRFILAL